MTWKYLDKEFNTKLEGDMYAEGYTDALKQRQCECQQKKTHIRTDV